MKYVVIFDIDGAVPIYSPKMEEPGGTRGTFELGLNAFRDRCGFIINDEGYIQLGLPALDDWQGPNVNDRNRKRERQENVAHRANVVVEEKEEKNKCAHGARDKGSQPGSWFKQWGEEPSSGLVAVPISAEGGGSVRLNVWS